MNPSQMLSGACCGLNSESVLAIGIVNGCGNYSYSLLLFVSFPGKSLWFP